MDSIHSASPTAFCQPHRHVRPRFSPTCAIQVCRKNNWDNDTARRAMMARPFMVQPGIRTRYRYGMQRLLTSRSHAYSKALDHDEPTNGPPLNREAPQHAPKNKCTRVPPMLCTNLCSPNIPVIFAWGDIACGGIERMICAYAPACRDNQATPTTGHGKYLPCAASVRLRASRRQPDC